MFRTISFAILLVTYAGLAGAQDLKLGFVDTARVLKEAPQADRARNKLETEFAPRDEKIVAMQKQLKELVEYHKLPCRVMGLHDLILKAIEIPGGKSPQRRKEEAALLEM